MGSANRLRDLAAGVTVVLFQPQNYVNTAGVVRAMKNFGLRRLRLVSPSEWDPWRIAGIAHDTQEIIEGTELFCTLDEALADCTFIAGYTARTRRAKRAVARPREVAPELLRRARTGGESGPAALLFGREDHGLPNDALDRCHRTVIIPTSPDHPSLNLAQAVLLAAYELWMAATGEDQPVRPPRHEARPATAGQLETIFEDMERALWTIDFFKSRKPRSTLRTLRELARRADPDAREAAFLRAIAIEVRKSFERRSGEPPGPH